MATDETAPKDREIIVWNKAEGSDPRCGYCECLDEAQAYERGGLCLYHGHAEGLSAGEDGLQIAVWGGGWDDSSHDIAAVGCLTGGSAKTASLKSR